MKLKQWIAVALAALTVCAMPVLAGAMDIRSPGLGSSIDGTLNSLTTGYVQVPCNAGSVIRFGATSNTSGLGCASGAPYLTVGATAYLQLNASSGAIESAQSTGNNGFAIQQNGARI